LIEPEGRILRIELRCAGLKASTRAHAPLALWMGADIEMVPESAFHLSREAGICRGQPGRAGERLTRSQCAAGALNWGRKKKLNGLSFPTAEACSGSLPFAIGS
jgi:hypothetical protein